MATSEGMGKKKLAIYITAGVIGTGVVVVTFIMIGMKLGLFGGKDKAAEGGSGGSGGSEGGS